MNKILKETNKNLNKGKNGQNGQNNQNNQNNQNGQNVLNNYDGLMNKIMNNVNANLNANAKKYDALASVIKSKVNRIIQFEQLRIQIKDNSYGVEVNILNDEDDPCISLEYNNGYLYLSNYYVYVRSDHECFKDHKWFFETFLIQLSKALKVKQVSLIDISVKTFTTCRKVPNFVFAFAKESFYEKYGFKNKEFQVYIEKNKRVTFGQFILDKSKSKSKSESNLILNSNLDDLYFAYNTFVDDISLADMNMNKLCQIILQSCKNGLGEILEYKDRIINIIKKYMPHIYPIWTLSIS
jgi:hypothetical protein